MPKIFITYCVILGTLLAIANHQGYVFSSLFSGTETATKPVHHRYHK